MKEKMAEKTTMSADDKKAAKRTKFLELAPARVGKALKAVALIQNFANATYDYDEAHVNAIVGALEKASGEVKAKLMARFAEGGAKAETPAFSFGDDATPSA